MQQFDSVEWSGTPHAMGGIPVSVKSPKSFGYLQTENVWPDAHAGVRHTLYLPLVYPFFHPFVECSAVSASFDDRRPTVIQEVGRAASAVALFEQSRKTWGIGRVTSADSDRGVDSTVSGNLTGRIMIVNAL